METRYEERRNYNWHQYRSSELKMNKWKFKKCSLKNAEAQTEKGVNFFNNKMMGGGEGRIIFSSQIHFLFQVRIKTVWLEGLL